MLIGHLSLGRRTARGGRRLFVVLGLRLLVQVGPPLLLRHLSKSVLLIILLELLVRVALALVELHPLLELTLLRPFSPEPKAAVEAVCSASKRTSMRSAPTTPTPSRGSSSSASTTETPMRTSRRSAANRPSMPNHGPRTRTNNSSGCGTM